MTTATAYAPMGPGPGPAPGASVRRRLVGHLVWEAVLAVAAVGVVAAALAANDRLLTGQLLPQVAAVGLLGAAMAVSLWAGAPNLAVGSIAVLTSTVAAWLIDSQGWSAWPALAAGVLLSIPIGLALGVIAGPLRVPGWAVTLVAALAFDALAIGVQDGRLIPVRIDELPTGVWFGLFVLVAAVTSGFTWLPGVRRLAPPDPGRGGGAPAAPVDRSSALPGAAAPAAPVDRSSALPGAAALVGLSVSSVLAAVAGVAIVSRIQATAVPGGGTSLTSALAVALLGGANPHGGRLGLAGTILAAVVVGGVNVLLAFHGQEVWVQLLATAALGFVGLLATLVLRAVSR